MKSKIRIELDKGNNPILRISHVDSEDLRDKAVGKFVEYGGVRYLHHVYDEVDWTKQVAIEARGVYDYNDLLALESYYAHTVSTVLRETLSKIIKEYFEGDFEGYARFVTHSFSSGKVELFLVHNSDTLESSGNLVGEILSYRKFHSKIYNLLDTWIEKHKSRLDIPVEKEIRPNSVHRK